MKKRKLLLSSSVSRAIIIAGLTLSMSVSPVAVYASEDTSETVSGQDTADADSMENAGEAETDNTGEDSTDPGAAWLNSDILGEVTADTQVSAKDDFASYANQEWLSTAQIPDGYSDYNAFAECEDLLKERKMALIGNSEITDHNEELVTDLYKIAMNWDRRNEVGLDELKPYLETIDQIETIDDLTNYLTDSEENLTGAFRRSFKKIQSEEELEAFLEDRREKFGLMHNTAYRKFRKMLDCLMNPQQENSVYPKEQSYSIRKLVNEYIRMGVPYRRKTGQYTWIQREIKKHWPSDRSIYEMYKRKMDVDRKTLLLLYLATEGEGLQEAEETGVQEHQRKMNVMLAECGMPVLNDRNPFDSLVLQVCRESSEEDYIGMQMERAVRSIFAEENAEKTTGGGMDKNES